MEVDEGFNGNVDSRVTGNGWPAHSSIVASENGTIPAVGGSFGSGSSSLPYKSTSGETTATISGRSLLERKMAASGAVKMMLPGKYAINGNVAPSLSGSVFDALPGSKFASGAVDLPTPATAVAAGTAPTATTAGVMTRARPLPKALMPKDARKALQQSQTTVSSTATLPRQSQYGGRSNSISSSVDATDAGSRRESLSSTLADVTVVSATQVDYPRTESDPDVVNRVLLRREDQRARDLHDVTSRRSVVYEPNAGLAMLRQMRNDRDEMSTSGSLNAIEGDDDDAVFFRGHSSSRPTSAQICSTSGNAERRASYAGSTSSYFPSTSSVAAAAGLSPLSEDRSKKNLPPRPAFMPKPINFLRFNTLTSSQQRTVDNDVMFDAVVRQTGKPEVDSSQSAASQFVAEKSDAICQPSTTAAAPKQDVKALPTRDWSNMPDFVDSVSPRAPVTVTARGPCQESESARPELFPPDVNTSASSTSCVNDSDSHGSLLTDCSSLSGESNSCGGRTEMGVVEKTLDEVERINNCQQPIMANKPNYDTCTDDHGREHHQPETPVQSLLVEIDSERSIVPDSGFPNNCSSVLPSTSSPATPVTAAGSFRTQLPPALPVSSPPLVALSPIENANKSVNSSFGTSTTAFDGDVELELDDDDDVVAEVGSRSSPSEGGASSAMLGWYWKTGEQSNGSGSNQYPVTSTVAVHHRATDSDLTADSGRGTLHSDSAGDASTSADETETISGFDPYSPSTVAPPSNSASRRLIDQLLADSGKTIDDIGPSDTTLDGCSSIQTTASSADSPSSFPAPAPEAINGTTRTGAESSPLVESALCSGKSEIQTTDGVAGDRSTATTRTNTPSETTSVNATKAVDVDKIHQEICQQSVTAPDVNLVDNESSFAVTSCQQDRCKNLSSSDRNAAAVEIVCSDNRADHLCAAESSTDNQKLVDVEFVKSSLGLGFCIEGGFSSAAGDRLIRIKKLFRTGPDSGLGDLKPGDEIMAVNGVDFTRMTHFDAWNLLKSLPLGICIMTVRRE